MANSKVKNVLWGLMISLATLIFGATVAPAEAIDWLKTGKDLLGGSVPAKGTSAPGGLTQKEIAAGLKEALRVGSQRVVDRLGALNGFYADPEIHIPLPENFARVRTALASLGQAGMLDDLELKLNRAAEAATPQAQALFLEAINDLTVDDVVGIYHGPENAATRYFEGKMSRPLSEAMQPIVADSLAQVGAVQTYDAIMGRYESLPFLPDVKADLTRHVVDKGMDGIFYYLGKEEAAIRQNPMKRTTQLLQQVFGHP